MTSSAQKFDVTLPFILQQAAWLYERQLSQVREQMRKISRSQAASPLQGLDVLAATSAQGLPRLGSRDGPGHALPLSKGSFASLNAKTASTSTSDSRERAMFRGNQGSAAAVVATSTSIGIVFENFTYLMKRRTLHHTNCIYNYNHAKPNHAAY